MKRHVETLVEDGLLEARGNGRERDFILSPKFYKAQKRVIEHVRQAGIGAVKNEDLIMQLVQEQGNVTRSDVAALLGVNPQIAYRLLKKLVEDGALVREGAKRLSVYRLA
mgnify:FL=1